MKNCEPSMTRAGGFMTKVGGYRRRSSWHTPSTSSAVSSSEKRSSARHRQLRHWRYQMDGSTRSPSNGVLAANGTGSSTSSASPARTTGSKDGSENSAPAPCIIRSGLFLFPGWRYTGSISDSFPAEPEARAGIWGTAHNYGAFPLKKLFSICLRQVVFIFEIFNS